MSKTCPICGKPVNKTYKPFCSKRCADVDLNRWLSGTYAVPVTEAEDEELAELAIQAILAANPA